MYPNVFLVAALLSASANAIPLNINLGAYSPALVVGDGEISFGGKADVSNLMNALEGAAISGGAQQAAAVPAAAPAAAPQQAAAAVAPVAAEVIPVEQAASVTSLQGMGKEIAPRVVALHAAASKRDIQGFNAALAFATGALKTSPEVQLGTGEGGSGVGIIQKAGGAPPAAKPARRSVKARREFSPKMKTTVTTMYVRGGALPAPARSEDSSIEKREPSSPTALDGVNLNMAEGQVAELTFVETKEIDEDDEEFEDDE